MHWKILVGGLISVKQTWSKKVMQRGERLEIKTKARV